MLARAVVVAMLFAMIVSRLLSPPALAQGRRDDRTAVFSTTSI